jgi:hypothetical protein
VFKIKDEVEIGNRVERYFQPIWAATDPPGESRITVKEKFPWAKVPHPCLITLIKVKKSRFGKKPTFHICS